LTGRRLEAPSDDPLAASELVQIRSRTTQVDGQRTNIGRVRGDVELTEGMLAQAGELMARARELAMQGASDQTGAVGRQTLAAQVQALRDDMLAIANTKGAAGYIFGGTQTDTPPFDAAGLFLGNDTAHNVDVGAGSPVRVNASGERAFALAGGQDIFGDLDNLIAALNANDGDGIRAELDNLDQGQQQLLNERGSAGLLLNRLDTSDLALERAELLLTQRDETIGGADSVEAYSDFVQLGQALERAIGVSRQLLSLGSLNQF
jgi:flagellar hook-associated protein 3 FlgL